MRLNADTIFNGLLVVFSCLLWWVTRRQVELTEKAEETSRKSLEIAALALKADRPYLLIEQASLGGATVTVEESMGSMANQQVGELRPYDRFHPWATFKFRNYGKGPALLEEILENLCVVETLLNSRDYTACRKSSPFFDAIGTGEPWKLDIFGSGKHDPSKYEGIRSGKKQLVVYGLVRYRDVFNNTYETGFSWILEKHRSSQHFTVGVFVRGSEKENYHT